MKLWNLFKKVIAVIIAIYLFMFSCITKASAGGALVFTESLGYLVPLIEAFLVGTGSYTSEQVGSMTDKMLFDAAADLADMSTENFFKVLVNTADLKEKLEDVISLTASDGIAPAISIPLAEWIKENQDAVATTTIIDGIDLTGFGAYAEKWFINSNGSKTLYQCIWASEYGLIDTTYSIVDPNYNAVGSGSKMVVNPNTSPQWFYSSDGATISVSYGTVGNNIRNPNVEIKLIGDWRNLDGELSSETITDGEVIPENIGEVTIDGVTYPINPDGTVTINGVTIPINPDGTVTYNNQTYSPIYNITNVYNDEALSDLLRKILLQLEGMTIVEEDTTVAPDLEDAVLPDALAASDLAQLQMPTGITSVFPFCIPWDVYYGIRLLAADPVAPRFEIPFEIPEIGGVFPGFKTSIVIDFADYDKYFKVVRWGTYFIAVMGICFMTFKIVKGNT